MGWVSRRPVVSLAVVAAAFALWAGRNLWTPLRSIDEAHCSAAAARLVEVGGPLYGNVMVDRGPALYWFAGTVFRLAGIYNMQALRIAEIAWWMATAFVIYAAARTMMGPRASLAAAGAFLLAASNPAFQDVRGEPLAALPIAAAVGLAVRGTAQRGSRTADHETGSRAPRFGAACLLLAGAAAALAMFARQQAGLVLPVVAAFPLMAWWWRRSEGGLWLAVCRSALVVGGFVAVVVAVWLSYALRGAGHAFYYGMWAYNWAFLRDCPAGGFLASPTYLWGRVARYVLTEPLLPLAVVGSVVGLAWRGPTRASGDAVAWRAKALMLVCLLAAMWVAASPGGIPAMPIDMYVYYKSLLYVPMCLLVGVCVEAALWGREGRRLAWAVAAGLAVAYVLIPTTRLSNSAAFCVSLYARMFGPWRIAAAAGLVAGAGWLFAGRRAAGFAFLAWVVLFVADPELLGWGGDHLAAASGAISLGVLWRARQRRALWMAAAAGAFHAASFALQWVPQLGLAAGAAAWVLLDRRLSRAERWAFAGVYLASVVPVGLTVLWVAGASPWGTLRAALHSWRAALDGWLSLWRLAGTLSLCGVLLLAWGSRTLREAWERVVDSPMGLLLFATLGALLAGFWRALEPGFSADAGCLAALAAALAVALLLRRSEVPTGTKASLLLLSGCMAAAMAAVVVSFRPPFVGYPTRDRERLAHSLPAGSRAYVWGTVFDTELYLRARAVPAAPQVFTWLLEGIGPPPLGSGLNSHPAVATLAGLDSALSDAPPDYVVILDAMPVPLSGFPRFGPILASRYRVTTAVPTGRVYHLVDP